MPDVYYDFIWPYKTTYRGYLQVQLLAMNRPVSREGVKHFTNIFQEEERKQVYQSAA